MGDYVDNLTMEKKARTSSFNQFMEDLNDMEFMPYLFLFTGIFFLLSILSFTENSPEISNIFGRIGHFVSYGSLYLFGRAAYIPGLFFLLASFSLFKKHHLDILQGIISLPLLLFSMSVALNIAETPAGSIQDSGGIFGKGLSYAIEFIFGYSGKIIVTLFILTYALLSMVSMTDFSRLVSFFKKLFHGIELEPLTSSFTTNVELPWVERKGEPAPLTAPRKTDPDRKNKLADYFPNENSVIKTRNRHSIFEGFFDDSDRVYQFSKTPEKTRIKLETTSPEYWKLKITDRTELPGEPAAAGLKSHTSYNYISHPSTVQEDTDFYDDVDYADDEEQEETETLTFAKYPEPQIKIEVAEEEPEEFDDEVEVFESEAYYQPEPRLFPAPVSMVPDVKLAKKRYQLQYSSVFNPVVHKNDLNSQQEAEKVARSIEDIILQYGYESKVVSIEKGPIITRFELTPPPGVKLQKITSLYDELKLYLAVKSIRIVAPIPGRSTIGIEVPNKTRDDVFLSDILKDINYPKNTKDISIPLGKDISGKNVFIELNKLPHLLIAGTTGSGKSVSLNAMIAATIFTKSPEDVRFIMIDPKMVELTLYEDIPHLLMPVITDPKKAGRALHWAIQEMEARYLTVSGMKCRDLKSYNEKIEKSPHIKNKSKMPYIVIFIDELADLMMVSGKDLEESITRISQKSRAVGIHLVMATQRPSVDVITGLIKANCPARVAFHVAQRSDSNIILGHNGAETLLGKGDLLYKSPTHAELIRIQAPYISEEEIEKIVDECSKFGTPSYVDFDLDNDENTDEFMEEDEGDFDTAWNIITTERKASASFLQRRMKIGYNKAARLMEIMEKRGYVSPQIGSKPREILK